MRTLAPFGRRPALVTACEAVGAYRLVTVADRHGPARPDPGQFYMLATQADWGGDEGRPYLPRAFSFCRSEPIADGEGGAWLSFLIDVVGPGSRRLAALEPGAQMLLTGPLGAGFARGQGRPLLVGGGIGVAPLVALQARLGHEAHTLLGFRSAEHAQAARLFDVPDAPDAIVASDDGSVGRRALVTELLREELDRDATVTVHACGPEPMLEAVRALCAERGVAAQLALEAGMACGFGACFGCVVATESGLVRLCVEGPVLDAAILAGPLDGVAA